MANLILSPLVLTLLMLIALLVVLVRRRERCGPAPVLLCAGALLLLGLGSSRPLSAALLQILEGGQAHARPAEGETVDAIVALGAGLRDRRTPRPVLTDSGKERLLEAVRLAREYPSASVVFSGGAKTGRGSTVADVMEEWAVRAGVEPDRVLAEPLAGSTRDSAAETAAIARQRGWSRLVLVTSAYHMPRSLAAFRAAGLDPYPAPCDFTDAGDLKHWVVPSTVALGNTQRFLREVAGRLWYRLRGWA